MNLNPLQITSSLISIVHRNPYLIVVLGDFNAQSKGWYPLGETAYEGTRIDGITSQFGLEKLIHETTHIIGERSSCIDSIFASQPNWVVESGVQYSLHQNCHNQIVFARFNLKVVFHLHMSVKYGILKKQTLTILRKKSMVFDGKNHFKI